MATTALLGGTGMVGSQILSTLLSDSQVANINILARRDPAPSTASAPPKLAAFINADTSKWAPYLKSLAPAPAIFFSALATTRGAAGSFENQYKLEHDLNVEMATAAKEAGSKVYVLISAGNANTGSMFAYSKMKGQIEEDIKALDFDHTVILRPGLIGGYREESRPAEAALRKLATGLGMISSRLKDPFVQDAEVIAKAAVSAGLKALNGEAPSKLWLINGSEILHEAHSK